MSRGRGRRYPRIERIRATPRCSICRERRSIVSILVQTGWSRSEDERLHLCEGCYAASGARELPERTRDPSDQGRAEPLLAFWRANRDRAEP